ncbi:MAG TPA: sulfotransferase domain-containing protein [Anaerolineae bacterium]|nr:sulfotransferase domain-containing protein [Anaerolineaceae bacterium]HRV94917.1 sulfotransferase domain-containing protein [Anaerolineae bacterium]
MSERLRTMDTIKGFARQGKKAIQPFYNRLYVDTNTNYRNSIFLAGTGRSGTTWVSDIINFKREYRYIFEPFYNAEVDLCRRFEEIQYLRPDNQDEYYLAAAKDILSGKIRNQWTDQYHRSFISEKRLIKDIRTNLMLKWINSHFPEIPIIFLMRHPCAVAKSKLRGKGWSSDLDLFLNQPALVDDFLQPFLAEIKAIKTDFEGHIFRWCLENYVPLKQFQPGQMLVTFYENFCEDPIPEIKRMFSFLEKPYDEAVLTKLKTPSPVTRMDSKIVTGGSLINGWREKITEQQTDRAIEILSLFGLDKIYTQASMPRLEGVQEVMGT